MLACQDYEIEVTVKFTAMLLPLLFTKYLPFTKGHIKGDKKVGL